MESAPASECPAADRSDNVLDPVCDGVGMDGERNHQRLREGTPGRKPVGVGRLFIRALAAFASSSLTAYGQPA